MRRHKIKFYSIHDMSSAWNLRECEEFFLRWEEHIANPDINTILELSNIKKYFHVDMRLEQWTDIQFADYMAKCRLIPEIQGKYCNNLSNSNFEKIFKTVERDYVDDFWQLICQYKVFQCIDVETMASLMSSNDNAVWYILRNRPIVNAFGSVIADHLADNCHTAEELMSYYLASHEDGEHRLYFPVEFTKEMREKSIVDYVECEDCNLNFLQLLEQAQDSNDLPISERLKLKARKKKEILQEKIFAGNTGFPYGAEVSIKSIPDGSVEEALYDNVASLAYSREWIEENQDYPTLMNNFIYIFEYVDRSFRCNFVSLKSEMGVFERHMGIKGKKDYMHGIGFVSKRMISLLQMDAYNEELKRLNIHIEDVFKWFFEDYLKNEFGATGFAYSPPSEGTTHAEKCKLLAIAIDGVLKQFRLFCEDGFVDRELLEMSSEHIVFSMVPSLLNNKYAYANSDVLHQEMFLLFSDQSMMNYTEKTGSKYKTLPQLLLSENMRKEDFADYQQKELEWLMKRGAVDISCDEKLTINKERVFVLRDLFLNEVICPIYYGEELQQVVAKCVTEGDMKFENTLFSKPEQDYLNFVLNKSEFSNGWDLRNKYCHDTYPLDEEHQKQDYLELLKIMVLIIIKINEEFCNKP